MQRFLFCLVLISASSLATPGSAARTHLADATRVDADGADGAGVAGVGSQLAINDAVALAKGFWAQTKVAGCLEAASRGPLAAVRHAWRSLGLAGSKNQLTQDLVQLVWAIELNQTTHKIASNPLFASITNSIFGMFKKEADSKQWLLEESKLTLKTQHNFDYDAAKQKCLAEVEAVMNRTEDMMEEEFSSPCSGGCSKKSRFIDSECREASETAFCPEGTTCGCRFDVKENLGAVVSAMTGVAYTGVGEAFLGALTVGLAAESVVVGVLMAALTAVHAKGCRCLPSPCAWDKSRGACAPAPTSGSGNPFQAVLPYVGTKCVAKPSNWRAHLNLDPGCEAAQPCALEDSSKIGQVGTDTFNCDYAATGGKSATLFPPMDARQARYRKLFPDVSRSA